MSIIYPSYNIEPDYKIINSSTREGKIKQLCLSVWKLGCMPFSKHTKNLDYEKCIEGLLGYENSVNIVYNLTVLAE